MTSCDRDEGGRPKTDETLQGGEGSRPKNDEVDFLRNFCYVVRKLAWGEGVSQKLAKSIFYLIRNCCYNWYVKIGML